jgi:hypothetical protein
MQYFYLMAFPHYTQYVFIQKHIHKFMLHTYTTPLLNKAHSVIVLLYAIFIFQWTIEV